MVYNAISHFKQHETTNNVPRKLRPRKTTLREDRMMVRLAELDPFKGSKDIKNELFGENNPRKVSARLVRRRLVEHGLHGRVCRKVPLLTKRHKEARLAFARKYGNWTDQEWKKVLFSDETKINMINSDGKRYVRRPVNKPFDPKFTKKTVKHGGGNIKVWGCFSGFGIGPVRKIKDMLDQHQYKKILEETMIPYSDEHLPVTWIFQQDNDPKHTANSVKAFIREQSLSVLDWPANSPDINPIENLWHIVKKKVSDTRYSNEGALYDGFVKAWNSIPLSTCENLIASMPRRCRAIIDNRGSSTKY